VGATVFVAVKDDRTQFAWVLGASVDFAEGGAADAAIAEANAQDDVHSAADRAYADAQDDSHSTADRAYTDAEVAGLEAYADAAADAAEAAAIAEANTQDDSHSTADRAYTDGEIAGLEVYTDNAEAAAKAYADAQDDSHSTADRAYTDAAEVDARAHADAEDDAHSTADRAYTDAAEAAAIAEANTQDDAHSTADRAYTDGEVASVHGGIDDHIAGTVGAHASSAISYDGSGNSALIQAWLTASELHTAVAQLAGQLYTPSEEEMNALIEALNALVDGEEIIAAGRTRRFGSGERYHTMSTHSSRA
jgi:hypothetical protein